jgi:cytoskeletal protein RodZ
MKTVGQILKAKRESLGRKLDDVARVTKIRKSYLEALESDDYRKLPGAAYAKGFIKNYAAALGINAGTLVAIFRRDFAENEKGQIIPRGVTEPLDKQGWFWTPKLTLIAGLTAVIVLISSYFGYQLYRLYHPALTILEPEENQVLISERVKVTGKADPSAVVKVNNQLVTMDADGNFEIGLTLTPGEQTITAVAETKKGNQTVEERKVIIRKIE